MTTAIGFWIGFNGLVIAMLLIDLFVHNKHSRELSLSQSLIWSSIWIATAAAFNVTLYFTHGSESALNFLTGYLIEKSLSIDNLFLFLLIFSHLQTPKEEIHAILFYGVLGALLMRGVLIFAGIALIEQFHWVLYLFAIFLILIGIKMFINKKNAEENFGKSVIFKMVQKWIPFTSSYHGSHFFIKQQGKWLATPLFITLCAIEITDLIFAIDSIPAILAITRDPFIVYTSNILAILGLRSLYFALSAFLSLFHYLHYALGAILTFIGAKMLLAPFFPISTWMSLGFIVLSISIAILFSLIYPSQNKSTT